MDGKQQRDLESNEDAHIIANEVGMTKDDDVARLAEIKTFRGMRHRSGHKVRGQRLRSNGRRGSALGVQRKKEVRQWANQNSPGQELRLPRTLGSRPD